MPAVLTCGALSFNPRRNSAALLTPDCILDFFTPTLLSMAVALAAFAGLLAGLLGIGGGIILVPLFLWLFKLAGMPAHLIVHSALGTSLCIILPTALSSTLGHLRRGHVDWHQVFYLAQGGVCGALLGSSLATLLSGRVLCSLFGIMQISIGLKLLIAPAQRSILPAHDPTGLQLALVGLAGGVFSSFFGVGGGVVAVPLMLLILRMPIHRAVGNSCALIVISALFGTLSYAFHGFSASVDVPYSFGYINLQVVLIVTPITMVFAQIGARFSSLVEQRKLIRLFALLLILVGVKLIFQR